ncbi:MAG: ATP-binding protein [Spongiibacteraceae bacterium]
MINITRPIIALLAFGLLLTALISYVDYTQSMAKREALMARELDNVKGTIEITLERYLTLILSMEAFVHANQDIYGSEQPQKEEFGRRFLTFAERLEDHNPNVMSLQLAPSGIINYMTQMEINASAYKHDLLKDDKRREQMIEAINQRGVFVAGPLTLVQGGEALVVRKAIFTKAGIFNPEQLYATGRANAGDEWPKGIDSDFWGMATLLVGVDKLYADLRLLQLPGQYEYALKGHHGLGEQGDIFWGDAQVFEQADMTTIIQLPHGTWVLALCNHEPSLMLRTGMIIGLGIVLTALAIYVLYSHQQKVQVQAEGNARSRFLASMSHEIRTPMNGIIGVTQLLEKSNLNAVQKNLVDKISVNGKLLLRLVNDVLYFSKINAGAMKIAVGSCCIKDIVSHAVSLVDVQARAKDLELKLQYLDGLPTHIIGDDIRIQQVLLNLLSNAVKFTDSGKVTLTVKPVIADGATRLCFSVVDTGMGITEKDQEKLFKPFAQVDESNTKKHGGTGLGLIISRQLARQMGGEVTVSSRRGKGSIFNFYLPLLAVDPDLNIPHADKPILVSEQKNTADLKILVVDDSEMNIEVAVMLLESIGYTADQAPNGKAAVAAQLQNSYDIIFMDRQMPEMDGLEATIAIRNQYSSTVQPWIIAMTASAQDDEKQEYLDAGANDFIGKPISFESLKEKINYFHSIR